MPTKMTPENGLHYRDALTHFISDETREEWKRAGDAAGWNKSRSVEITTDGAGVSKNQRYDAVRRFMSAENAIVREFRELVTGGYIVGFGYPDTLEIETRRMPSEEWSFLSWKSRDGTTFEGGAENGFG